MRASARRHGSGSSPWFCSRLAQVGQKSAAAQPCFKNIARLGGAGERNLASALHTLERRSADTAGQRDAIFDRRDIDGELAVSGDELAAAHRFDQQAACAHVRAEAGDEAFLGRNRRMGRQGFERQQNDRLGAHVGLGDR